jgi:putative ABC transport system permease protein
MPFLRLPALLIFMVRRLWNNKGLLLGAAVGLVVAVTLAMSVPLYAEAADYQLLRDELSYQQAGFVRPPFAFKFRYAGFLHGAIDWEQALRLSPFFDERTPELIGLPLEFEVRHVATGLMRVYAPEQPKPVTVPVALDIIFLGFISDLEAHIRMVEGAYPTTPSDGDPLPVLIAEAHANETGFTVGETLIVEKSALGLADTAKQIRVRIAGVWVAKDERDPYWFDHATDYRYAFLTTEAAFVKAVVPAFSPVVYHAVWYQVFDGGNLHTQDVIPFVTRIANVRAQLRSALPNADLDLSPERVMANYTSRTQFLTILMYVFAAPIVCITLYFIVFLANLVVSRQRNEIAILRSRGASRRQVVLIYLIERLLIGAAALALGLVLGQAVARVMGSVQSFLMFAPNDPIAIHVSPRALLLGVAGVVISLVASLTPALSAASQSIISHKQDVARSMHRPRWQALYLDVILLAVSLYGYYMLQQRGTISFLGRGAGSAEGDPFRNPLLFLVPAVFVFALALVLTRLLPVLIELLARVQLFPLPVLLALRQLGRSRAQYSGPLLLIMLTLGLASFTASMAKTLDRGLVDRAYYDAGADLRLREIDATDDTATGAQGSPFGAPAQQKEVFPTFLPVSEHLKIAGVQAAARLGSADAILLLGNRELHGRLFGIDRAAYPNAAFFRQDFAPSPLGDLLNRLALVDNAALVPSSLLQKQGLAIGDSLNVIAIVGQQRIETPLTIAGIIDLFPTYYPSENTPFFVTNLDYMFERAGGEFTYDVLLRVDPLVASTESILVGIQRMGLLAIGVTDARARIEDERTQPERQGILGLLSVGFVVSALLTVLGFFYYAFLSFQRRSVELGVLRALGLSMPQMASFLCFEQGILIGISLAAGTMVGLLTSHLFIPMLQVRSGVNAQIPPYIVDVAWGDLLGVYLVFGVMFLIALVSLIWLLGRVRIATAIKMGETT